MLISVALWALLSTGANCTNQVDRTCSVIADIADNEAQLIATEREATGTGAGTGTNNSADPGCVTGGVNRECIFTVTGPLTLQDIAAFRPTPASRSMQPNGWAVRGLDANFLSSGASDIQSGTLLGQSAEVRFTPVRWRWDYGDGATRTSRTPGEPWTPRTEFDPTPTSHVYEQNGTYPVTLTVDYAVEYRLAGGPWIPIPGILSRAAAPLTVTIGSAKTVLVERDCLSNPTGPGC